MVQGTGKHSAHFYPHARARSDPLPSTRSDATLVERAENGDLGAFAVLYERHWERAFGLARAYVRGHEDAEDVTQESMIAALERLKQCSRPHRFGGWLMAIVRNRSMNYVRSRAVRHAEQIPHDMAAATPDPDRAASVTELRGSINVGLAALSETRRAVFLMHDLEGWKHREIAELLDMECGSVRSSLWHARRDLRGALGAFRRGVG